MTNETDLRAMTIRLTSERHEAATRLAQQMNISLNQLMQQALDELLRLDQDMALYRAATQLGANGESERD